MSDRATYERDVLPYLASTPTATVTSENTPKTASDLEASFAQLEEQRDAALDRVDDLDDRVRVLEADRAEMLDRLGMTEHEWEWRKLDYVSPFRKKSIKTATVEVVAEQDDIPDLPVDLVDEIPDLPDDPPASSITWTQEQQDALNAVGSWLTRTEDSLVPDTDDNFLSLVGYAGTGKTVLLGEIARRHAGVTLVAMTGKAALRLQQATGFPATTLHRVLYWPPEAGQDLRFERLREPPSRIVAVDESSMTGPTVKKHLRAWTSLGVRVLLVGDGFQLPPVISAEEAKKVGSEDYSVFAEVKGPTLSTVMRSVGGVLRAATKVRETGEIVTRSDLDGPKSGYEYRRVANPLAVAVEEYLADPEDHLLLTWTNSQRMKANAAIRARLGHEGPLPDPGEPVLIRKNGQGRMNGEILSAGTFETGPVLGSMRTLWMTFDSGEKLLVSVEGGDRQKGGEWMDGQMPWVEDWKKYQVDLRMKVVPEPVPLSWGYCVTAHAGQGSQARRTTVFLDRGELKSQYFRKPTTLPDGRTASFASRWIYTATTRSVAYTLMVTS